MDTPLANGPVTACQMAHAATLYGKLHETGVAHGSEAHEIRRLRELRRLMRQALKNEQQRPGACGKGVLA